MTLFARYFFLWKYQKCLGTCRCISNSLYMFLRNICVFGTSKFWLFAGNSIGTLMSNIHNIHLVHYLWRRELILILPRPTARRAISRRRQELPELRASSSSAAWARCAAWLSAGGSRTQSGGRCKGGGDGIALHLLSHMSFFWMEGMSREHK